jgi:hypothetical protein
MPREWRDEDIVIGTDDSEGQSFIFREPDSDTVIDDPPPRDDGDREDSEN